MTVFIQNLASILEKCRSMSELKQLHALIFTLGLSQEDEFVSRILSFSALSHSGNVHYSYKLLLHLPNPTVFHWNTVIRGYSSSKNPNRAPLIFVTMLRFGVTPDHLTFPFLAKASARLLNSKLGSSIHAHVVKKGYEFDRFIQNSLIHLYASCLDIAYARKVFDILPVRNSVSWNAMLDGYAKCGDLNTARKLFDLMPERDVVSWSSLIDGYVKVGEHREAMALFDRMRLIGPKANEVTMVSVLCACAHLGALDKGKSMHNYINENMLPLTIVLQTSIVDMYAKCGAINEALAVFRACPRQKADVLIWNTMIGGLATHGFVKESVDLFEEMVKIGIDPDDITYLCLLSACAHGGLVKKAWHFFDCLRKHGMTPKTEHYACMVDVLSRAGQVEEAHRFLCEMPTDPTASMLGALLNGCLNYKKLELAESVGKKLVELDPQHDGRYIGLSNVYAVTKRWDDAKSTRQIMEKRGVRKSPGFSFVEIFGRLHRFIAHDKTHCDSENVYRMLNFVVNEMKHNEDYENQEYFWYRVDSYENKN